MNNGLGTVDLNLLIVLDALLEERHVTRAGVRVGLSQPATSNALKRLRRAFGDELLEKSGARLELTPVARSLQEPVREAIRAAERVFTDHAPFAPREVRGRIRLAATDHFIVVAMLAIERALAAEAPNLSVEVFQYGVVDDLDLLSVDRLDLVIGTFSSLPPRVRRMRLFHDPLACLLRADHPALLDCPGEDDVIPIGTFLAYPHLRVAPRAADGGAVAAALADLGADRRVRWQIPTFLAAPFMLESSDMISVLSARVARRFTSLLPLTTRRPPLPLRGFETDMVWHTRSDDDPLMCWVRERIRAVSEDVTREAT